MVDFRYIYMEAVSATARSVADYIFVGHRVLPQPTRGPVLSPAGQLPVRF